MEVNKEKGGNAIKCTLNELKCVRMQLKLTKSYHETII